MLLHVYKEKVDNLNIIDIANEFGCDSESRLSTFGKGPVKLIKRVKIAHSFLQSVSNQFHIFILSLPM